MSLKEDNLVCFRMSYVKCKGMKNVTFHEYKKFNFVFTILHLLVVDPSFSNFRDVLRRIKFFKVSLCKFSIHFPERQVE